MLHSAPRRARRAMAAQAAVRRRGMHALPAADVRASFLQFFEANGHEVVPSGSLVPPGSDTSLLFTNAGMVPFKQCFLGTEQRPYTRATSVQRCIRAGGKHNDLDQVGLTRRHHTLFEMLGNFSFGDYFKADAIAFSWQFLTKELGLPKDRLHVTVLERDDEARQLWKKIAQLSDSKIIAHDESENFWAMGDSGPCGPCSEIFWDLGDHIDDPDERFLELWNLVFMQYFRNEGDASGALHTLPKPSVDTGMGLERIASVLQGVPSNYHTDAFVPLMARAVDVMDRQRKRGAGRSFADVLEEELDPRAQRFGTTAQIQTVRIVADHLKAAYAMLSDGIFPSNIGRGYVLRRILRRAMRHAQNCGVNGPFLATIRVPEWERASGFAQMRGVIANEERAFEEMLVNGQRAMEKVFTGAAAGRTIAGADAFRLYDTYGIPLDITQVLADERGLTVDAAGFDACLDDHKRKAAANSAFASHHGDVNSGDSASASPASSGPVAGAFVGYDTLSVDGARVLSVWGGANKPSQPATFWVSLDRSPFYAEGGGQVGDRGRLVVQSPANGDMEICVRDTKRFANDAVGLECEVPAGKTLAALESLLFAPTASVSAHVDITFRTGCAVHHSATHLLQRALKQELGEHVTQCGSFVTGDRLRFDFAHFGALSLDEMARVEQRVNDLAAAALAVETRELPRAAAEQSGAICNFGDKYGDVVRVVRIGDVSSEFCGGTHVHSSAAIFPFVLLSEGSVAAGTRRIEAVAGMEGARHLQTKDRALQSLAAQLETTPAKVSERVTKLQKHVKELESYAQALGDLLAGLPAAPVATGRINGSVNSDAVQIHELDTGSSSNREFAKVLRRRAEFLLQDAPERVHVVVMGTQIVCVSNSAHAGKLLQQVLKPLGGRGGGNASFAQGSLPAPESVQALARRVLS